MRTVSPGSSLGRDRQPSNIFVCERGGSHDVVKLLDFGLVHIRDRDPAQDAQKEPPSETGAIEGETALPPAGLLSARDLTHTGQFLGTPAYMAPELIGEQQPDARSDIYSLGGVACFLLAGRPPFERETLAELYSAHVHAPLPRLREQLPELKPDLESVILHGETLKIAEARQGSKGYEARNYFGSSAYFTPGSSQPSQSDCGGFFRSCSACAT